MPPSRTLHHIQVPTIIRKERKGREGDKEIKIQKEGGVMSRNLSPRLIAPHAEFICTTFKSKATSKIGTLSVATH